MLHESPWPPIVALAPLTALVGSAASSRDAVPAGQPEPVSAHEGFVPTGALLVSVQAATGASSAVVVPQSPVILVDGIPTVFVAEPDVRLLVATPVELGETLDAERSITGGLSAGAPVVAGDLGGLARGLETL